MRLRISTSAREAAGVTRREATPAQSLSAASNGFFLCALIFTCVRIAPIEWFKSGPAYLVFLAGTIALAGLFLQSVERRAEYPIIFERLRLSPEGWSTLAVFTAFLAFYAVTSFAETGFNEQVRQAVALLHGHTYIDAPEHSYIEYYQDGPYKYALHPALSAILLIPLASIWGLATPQTAFSVLVGALDVALMWRLLGRFLLNVNARIWLTFFFGAGTVFWFETIQGASWSLPMVVAVCFILAALIETFGRVRPVWLGTFAALACLARYDLVLCAPVFAELAHMRGRRIREVLWMAPGFIVVGVVFGALNEARFHSFFDMGVILNQNGPKGQPIFSLGYLPGNLYTIFFMAPAYDSRFPYIHPTFMGQAIPLTSPAFVMAFRASLRRAESLMMWLAALLGSLPSLLCWMNGYAQFGTRHYIPVFPFLLVLAAFGIRRRADQLTKILIGTSIGLVTFGIWHVHMWGFG